METRICLSAMSVLASSLATVRAMKAAKDSREVVG
jgi:hypothetical protein